MLVVSFFLTYGEAMMAYARSTLHTVKRGGHGLTFDNQKKVKKYNYVYRRILSLS